LAYSIYVQKKTQKENDRAHNLLSNTSFTAIKTIVYEVVLAKLEDDKAEGFFRGPLAFISTISKKLVLLLVLQEGHISFCCFYEAQSLQEGSLFLCPRETPVNTNIRTDADFLTTG